MRLVVMKKMRNFCGKCAKFAETMRRCAREYFKKIRTKCEKTKKIWEYHQKKVENKLFLFHILKNGFVMPGNFIK